MSRIEIRDFSQRYKERGSDYLALDHVNLNIEQGEFVCLIGHSGCGKSTLLAAIDGLLDDPETGGIYVDGERVTSPGGSRALIFQNYSLFPWLTAADNIIFANEQLYPEFREKTRKEKQEHADIYLSQVGLEEEGNKYPGELSGGMQQRIAIARALSVNPQILLADEPFGALDPRNRTRLQNLLVEVWQQASGKLTVIFVTHDIDEAILLSDRIVFMKPRIVAEVIENPLKRPRDRSELLRSKEYNDLRNHLAALFYHGENEYGEQEIPPHTDARKRREAS